MSAFIKALIKLISDFKQKISVSINIEREIAIFAIELFDICKAVQQAARRTFAKSLPANSRIIALSL